MDRIKKMIATYKAKFFINHDKEQTDQLKGASNNWLPFRAV